MAVNHTVPDIRYAEDLLRIAVLDDVARITGRAPGGCRDPR